MFNVIQNLKVQNWDKSFLKEGIFTQLRAASHSNRLESPSIKISAQTMARVHSFLPYFITLLRKRRTLDWELGRLFWSIQLLLKNPSLWCQNSPKVLPCMTTAFVFWAQVWRPKARTLAILAISLVENRRALEMVTKCEAALRLCKDFREMTSSWLLYLSRHYALDIYKCLQLLVIYQHHWTAHII